MKKKIIEAAAALFLTAGVCLTLHFTVNPTIVREVSDDAAAKIAESWLRKQISLRDYEVTEAHFMTVRGTQKKYVAMTYSVKPRENALTSWYAGNGEDGEDGEDGWLVDKYGFISYRRAGPYVVTGTACNTGP